MINFSCPKCKGRLNVGSDIVFAAKKKDGENGVVFLSTAVGNYEHRTNDTFKFEKGEELHFFCPMCSTSLVASDVSHNLARVIMEEDDNTSEIFFSVVAGQQCTYKVKEHNVESYGLDQESYMNFFGEIPKY